MRADDNDWPFRPDPVFKREVVFTSAPKEKIVPDEVSGSVKVRVLAPFRVLVAGKPYTAGDEVEVPAGDKTKFWLGRGWVEPVAPPAAKTKAKASK